MGFFPRKHVRSAYGVYSYGSDELESQTELGSYAYSMVLTGAAFVHLNYLKMFNSTSATPKAVHELIDELHNCEDLAVNVMVGDYLAKVERPQCSGLFVKPTKVINLEKETGKFAILLSLLPSFPYHQSVSSSLLPLPPVCLFFPPSPTTSLSLPPSFPYHQSVSSSLLPLPPVCLFFPPSPTTSLSLLPSFPYHQSISSSLLPLPPVCLFFPPSPTTSLSLLPSFPYHQSVSSSLLPLPPVCLFFPPSPTTSLSLLPSFPYHQSVSSSLLPLPPVCLFLPPSPTTSLSLPPSFPYHQSVSSSLLPLPPVCLFFPPLPYILDPSLPSLLLPSRLCSSSFPPFFFPPSPFSFLLPLLRNWLSGHVA